MSLGSPPAVRHINVKYLPFFHKEDLSLLPHSFAYLTLCLCRYRLMDIYFMLWVIIPSCMYSVTQIILALAVGTSLRSVAIVF